MESCGDESVDEAVLLPSPHRDPLLWKRVGRPDQAPDLCHHSPAGQTLGLQHERESERVSTGHRAGRLSRETGSDSPHGKSLCGSVLQCPHLHNEGTGQELGVKRLLAGARDCLRGSSGAGSPHCGPLLALPGLVVSLPGWASAPCCRLDDLRTTRENVSGVV